MLTIYIADTRVMRGSGELGTVMEAIQ